MRRTDRQITDPAVIGQYVAGCKVLRLGLTDDDAPYVVPLNFGWERTQGRWTFYIHCAAQGRKLDLLARCPRVCVEMDGGHGLIAGERPCDFSYTYYSVIGWGRAVLVTDTADKQRALACLLEHQTGQALSVPAEQAAAVTVVRIDVDTLTAKAHREAAL